MGNVINLALAVVLVALGGCSPAVEYRPTIRSFEAREEGCDFRIFRGYIADPYLVLGRVEMQSFAPGNLPRTHAALREAIGSHVCAAGGDGFMPVRNPTGHFAHGVIVRFVPRATPALAEACPPVADDPETAPDGEAPDDGTAAAEPTDDAPEANDGEGAPSDDRDPATSTPPGEPHEE